MDEGGAVKAAAHVVLARPHDLHRHAGGLRDDHGLADEIGHGAGAAPEAAAEERRVDLDLVGRRAEDLRRGHLVAGLELRAGPDLAAIAVDLDRTVERLHRRVREVGHVVLRLEPGLGSGERVFHLADAGGDRAWRPRLRVEVGEQLGAVDPAALGLRPLGAERVAPELGGPEMRGDDGDAVRGGDDLLDAGHLEGVGGVELDELGAERRRAEHGGAPAAARTGQATETSRP